MNISPRSSMTVGQLAQLYNGNPNVDPSEVASNIFLGSSQGTDYLNQQGQNLGIGDPATYFQQARNAQRAAQTPSGGTMEAMRLAGQYDPNSLPGQLQAHQQQIDGVMAGQALAAKNLADLQNAQAQHAYPLPTPGVAPTLSPVMQAAMQQQGIKDPTAFLMQQRLGNNLSAVSPFSSVPSGQVKPDDLYHEPTFQANMQANPAKASQVFSALTGGDLGQFHTNYLKSQADEQKFRDDTLRSELASGGASTDDQGNVVFSQKVFDPVANKMVPTGKFTPGTPYQKILAKSSGRVAPEIAEFQQLAAQRNQGGAAGIPVAPLQQGQDPNVVPAPYAAGSDPTLGSGILGTVDNFLGATVGDLKGIVTGNSTAKYGRTGSAADFDNPSGQAAIHAAPLLRNNPQFQQLLRTNPTKARAIIMAVQQGNLTLAPH